MKNNKLSGRLNSGFPGFSPTYFFSAVIAASLLLCSCSSSLKKETAPFQKEEVTEAQTQTQNGVTDADAETDGRQNSEAENRPEPENEAESETSKEEESVSGSGENRASDSALEVTVLDVDQGLCVYAECDGISFLYDGGDRQTTQNVVAFLNRQNLSQLDYVIVSHYDADHLNGIVAALNNYDVKTLIAPEGSADTRVYRSFEELVKKKNLDIIHPELYDSWNLGSASFEILGPVDSSGMDSNNSSIIVQLKNGASSLLLCGDAEWISEEAMVSTMGHQDILQSDLLLLGHHGSDSSTSELFLDEVSPQAAILSCGADNSYGHPHATIMNELKERNIPLYRTDLQHDLHFTLLKDRIEYPQALSSEEMYLTGKEVSEKLHPQSADSSAQSQAASNAPSNPEQAPAPSAFHWILNTNSKKIHRPDCQAVKKMSEKNKKESDETLEALIAQGYSRCKICLE